MPQWSITQTQFIICFIRFTRLSVPEYGQKCFLIYLFVSSSYCFLKLYNRTFLTLSTPVWVFIKTSQGYLVVLALLSQKPESQSFDIGSILLLRFSLGIFNLLCKYYWLVLQNHFPRHTTSPTIQRQLAFVCSTDWSCSWNQTSEFKVEW